MVEESKKNRVTLRNRVSISKDQRRVAYQREIHWERGTWREFEDEEIP